jgi:hypothetical protein
MSGGSTVYIPAAAAIAALIGPSIDIFDLSEPEFLALAYITAIELEAERSVVRRAELEGLVNRLVAFDATRLSAADRQELGYFAKREIETNRYPLAPHLEPLRSAFAKLCPADAPPKPPGGRKARR